MPISRAILMLISFLGMSGCTTSLAVVGGQSPASTDLCGIPQALERGSLPMGLAELQAMVDDVFGDPDQAGPGSTVLLLHAGDVVAQRHGGLASLEHSVPFRPDHTVRLPYSEGREFMAVAAVFMENDGLITIDDKVRGYFPDLPDWSAPVTIRDLIHHRSGFVDEWTVLLLMHTSMGNRFERPQFLRLLYDQPAPEVEPGTGYMYSNSDYGLLRLLLEDAAGEDLGAYMKRRVFDPLEMSATLLVGDFSEAVPQHAMSYAPKGDGFRHQEIKTSPGGDYVIATSACDLARWAKAHSDPESEVSLATSRLAEGAKTLPGRAGHLAFGHTVTEVGGTRVIRHEGVNEVNYLTRIPGLGLSLITFGNGYYEPEKNDLFLNLLLDAEYESVNAQYPTDRIAMQPAELARYAGHYVSTNTPSWENEGMARDIISIDATRDGLDVSWAGWGQFRLAPVGEDLFTWHEDATDDSLGMLFEFSDPDENGLLKLVIRYSDGYPEEHFSSVGKWAPSAELLNRIAGTYYSSYLDYTWRLVLDESGGLVFRAATLADIDVEPYQEGEFILRHERFPGQPEIHWIRVHEGESGEITHLTVWATRLMNLRLDRLRAE